MARSARRIARVAAPAAALALLVAAAVAGATSPAKGKKYTGSTSERIAISFRVSADGRHVTSFSTTMGYDGKCGPGGGAPYVVKASSISISNGAFHKRVTAHGPAGSRGIPGRKFDISGRFSGSGGKTAKGSVNAVGLHCVPPNQRVNPYAATFKTTAH
jgi:hypothetical protein